MNAKLKTLRILVLIVLTACFAHATQGQTQSEGMWMPEWKLTAIAQDLIRLDQCRELYRETRKQITIKDLTIQKLEELDRKNVALLKEKDFQLMVLNQSLANSQKEIVVWQREAKKQKRQRKIFTGAIVVVGGSLAYLALKR